MAPGISLRPERQTMSASDKNDPSKPSGRVRHDSGGRAVWEWAVESGRHAVSSTSALLKKLELSGLHLLEDKKKPTAGSEEEEMRMQEADRKVPTFGGERELDPLRGKRGFNPYDSRQAALRKAAQPQPPPKPRITQPVRPAKGPGLFARIFGKDKK
jgi:hypothetical protein